MQVQAHGYRPGGGMKSMATPKFLYQSEYSRAWSDGHSITWEVKDKHPVTGKTVWNAPHPDDLRINNVDGFDPDHPCAEHRASAPVGTREIWIVPSWPGRDGWQLVADRTAEQKPGGVFWGWRLYVRRPLVMPGASYAYRLLESSETNEQHEAHAILRVLTGPPDMVVGPERQAASDPGATIWRDGPPPRTEPGKPVYVWREGCPSPVSVMYSEGERGRPPGMVWLDVGDPAAYRYDPWGDARWAPIPRPDHNPKS